MDDPDTELPYADRQILCGKMRLEVPLSTLTVCHHLQQHQQLQLTAVAHRSGSDSEQQEEDVLIDVNKDDQSVYFSLQTKHRSYIEDMWNCVVTKCQLIESSELTPQLQSSESELDNEVTGSSEADTDECQPLETESDINSSKTCKSILKTIRDQTSINAVNDLALDQDDDEAVIAQSPSNLPCYIKAADNSFETSYKKLDLATASQQAGENKESDCATDNVEPNVTTVEKISALYCGQQFRSLAEEMKYSSPPVSDSLSGLAQAVHSIKSEDVTSNCPEQRSTGVEEFEMSRKKYPVRPISHNGATQNPNRQMSCRFCNKNFDQSKNPLQAVTSHEVRWCRGNPSSRACEMAADSPQNDRPYKCSKCPQAFRHKQGLSIHLGRCHRNHDQSLLLCRFCGESFPKRSYCLNHERYKCLKNPNISECHPCSRCAFRFSNKEDLDEHFAQTHKEPRHGLSEEYPIGCPQCTEAFKSSGGLACHLTRAHKMPGRVSRRLECRFCEKTFKPKQRSNRHFHENYRCAMNPNVHAKCVCCPRCNRRFPSRDLMKHHLELKHQGDSVVVCELCGVSFNSKSGLKQHRNKVHKLAEDKHQCTHCDKKFLYLHLLEKHMITHSDERNVQCAVCGKRFKDKAQEIRHRSRVHEGKYPYRCDKCGHGVGKKIYLDKHVCGRVRRPHSDHSIDDTPLNDPAKSHLNPQTHTVSITANTSSPVKQENQALRPMPMPGVMPEPGSQMLVNRQMLDVDDRAGYYYMQNAASLYPFQPPIDPNLPPQYRY